MNQEAISNTRQNTLLPQAVTSILQRLTSSEITLGLGKVNLKIPSLDLAILTAAACITALWGMTVRMIRRIFL